MEGLKNLAPEDIKSMRKYLNFSQEEFARKLGVAYGTVWKWENDKAVPQGKNYRKLLKVQQKLNDRKLRLS